MAVLLGGRSAEREVSLKTGEAVCNVLVKLGYDAHKVDVGSDVCTLLEKARPDAAFIALHGRHGEDGTIQGLLELMEIPYTGSGMLASSLAINKIMSKKIFREAGIPVAPDLVVSRADLFGDLKDRVASSSEISMSQGYRQKLNRLLDKISSSLSLPVIVKPSQEGSTIGVTIVDGDEILEAALETAFGYDDNVLIEKFIPGKLLTVSLLGKTPDPLPVIEISAKKGFYDYEAKYTPGMTDYIVPAELPARLTGNVQEMAVRAHQALGCEDISRVDLILGDDGGIYVLEVNTIPGMTETSLVPQAAAARGISFEQLVETILEGARLKLKIYNP